jgi:lipopolysaccharide/colanic/teichoic acid biosynthesis glycosyltransferase
VQGRAELTGEERLRLELEYVDHYSLWCDWLILVRTIPAVLKDNGAR